MGFLLICGLGYVVLINPDNPLTRRFQRKLSEVDSRILIGPYPVEADFRLLRDHRVTLIVSLLDPALPYEGTLLEKEKRLAAAYGMRVANFPMASILGRGFGSNYEKSAAQAAKVIAGTTDKVYLHCYLGLHRIQVVKDLLVARGVGSARYLVRLGEREKARLVLDAAEAAYNNQRYADALTTLGQLPPADRSAGGRILEAWAHYRLQHFEKSSALFLELVEAVPNNLEANLGGGYSELRRGRLPAAIGLFEAALRLDPENAEALGGLGLAQYQAGRLQPAAENIEHALRLAPENSELRQVLGHLRENR